MCLHHVVLKGNFTVQEMWHEYSPKLVRKKEKEQKIANNLRRF
jgi:hypothetical protein